MKMKRCRKHNCRNLIPYEQYNPYCDKHSKSKSGNDITYKGVKHTKQIENKHRYDKVMNYNFYQTKEWAKLSQYIKRANVYTDSIDSKLLRDNDIIVDHIVPRRLLPQSEWLNADNLWCISRYHHRIKTNMEATMSASELKRMSRSDWKVELRAYDNSHSKRRV